MKKSYLAAFVFLLLTTFLTPAPAFADLKGTGLGVTIGNPLGVTGRTWVSEENSIDYGAGWGIMDTNRFHIYADYLWNKEEAFELNNHPFDFFFGAGVAMRSKSGKYNSDAVLGPRLPVGVSYEFAKPKLELFAVFAANVGLIPSADFWVDLHVGARFYLF